MRQARERDQSGDRGRGERGDRTTRESRGNDRIDERDDRQAGEAPGPSNPMDRAANLLRAGDEAIEQVLSGDSLRFLEASRQLGGQ